MKIPSLTTAAVETIVASEIEAIQSRFPEKFRDQIFQTLFLKLADKVDVDTILKVGGMSEVVFRARRREMRQIPGMVSDYFPQFDLFVDDESSINIMLDQTRGVVIAVNDEAEMEIPWCHWKEVMVVLTSVANRSLATSTAKEQLAKLA